MQSVYILKIEGLYTLFVYILCYFIPWLLKPSVSHLDAGESDTLFVLAHAGGGFLLSPDRTKSF